MRDRRFLLLAVTAIAVLSLGCVLLAPTETPKPPTPTDTAAVAEADETTAAPTEESPTSPTETGAPDATSTATAAPPSEDGCTLDAAFVADVTIPDDTNVAPGTDFRKTWRLRNEGSCNWKSGTELVFASGDPLGGPPSVIAPAAEAGAVVNVSVDLTAPEMPGTYRSNWQLQSPKGQRFGPTIYVQIVVPGEPTTEPTTETPATTPTDAPTTEPSPEIPTCSISYAPAFSDIVERAYLYGLDIGCPQGEVYQTYGAAQVFTANVDSQNPSLRYRTLMIWNRPYKQGEIYYVTLSETSPVQTLYASYDTWEEAQPEVPPDCADMEVPTGFLMPIRGFGKLWCDRELWKTIGWPRNPEVGLDFLVQHTENGRLMQLNGPLHETFTVAWLYDGNQAVITNTP